MIGQCCLARSKYLRDLRGRSQVSWKILHQLWNRLSTLLFSSLKAYTHDKHVTQMLFSLISTQKYTQTVMRAKIYCVLKFAALQFHHFLSSRPFYLFFGIELCLCLSIAQFLQLICVSWFWDKNFPISQSLWKAQQTCWYVLAMSPGFGIEKKVLLQLVCLLVLE